MKLAHRVGGQWPLAPARGPLSARHTAWGGSSSEVYAAEDLADHAPCAVKLFPAELEPGTIARLLDEFGRLSELSHRGIVKVRDTGRISEGGLAGRTLPGDGPALRARLAAHLAAAMAKIAFAASLPRRGSG